MLILSIVVFVKGGLFNIKNPKHRWVYLFLSILFLFFFITSCSARSNEDTIKKFVYEDEIYFSENLPFGTNYDDALKIYWDEKLDPESDQYEEWRVSQNSIAPASTTRLYGLDWTPQLSFDEDGTFYAASYSCHMDQNAYQKNIKKIADDCYDQLGEGSVSQKDFTEWAVDAKGKMIGVYWQANHDSFLQLTVYSVSDNYLVGISVGKTGEMEIFSGIQDML